MSYNAVDVSNKIVMHGLEWLVSLVYSAFCRKYGLRDWYVGLTHRSHREGGMPQREAGDLRPVSVLMGGNITGQNNSENTW